MTDQAIEQLTHLAYIVAAGDVLFVAGFALAYVTGGEEFRLQVREEW